MIRLVMSIVQFILCLSSAVASYLSHHYIVMFIAGIGVLLSGYYGYLGLEGLNVKPEAKLALSITLFITCLSLVAACCFAYLYTGMFIAGIGVLLSVYSGASSLGEIK